MNQNRFCESAVSDVRFTPKSGHQNWAVVPPRRNKSGSLAIFAAIRRASSLVSSFAAEPSNDFSNQRLSPSHA
jgi:hypothetical protein